MGGRTRDAMLADDRARAKLDPWWWVPVLVIGMLVTGSANTLSKKFAYQTESPVNNGGEKELWHKPWTCNRTPPPPLDRNRIPRMRARAAELHFSSADLGAAIYDIECCIPDGRCFCPHEPPPTQSSDGLRGRMWW